MSKRCASAAASQTCEKTLVCGGNSRYPGANLLAVVSLSRDGVLPARRGRDL